MNKVEIKFFSRAVKKGGLVLYNKKDSIDFVINCKIEKIKLLGIDGYIIIENFIQPNLDYSIDFSSYTFSGNEYDEAPLPIRFS